MQADYMRREELQHLLAALMPENRLALEISLATGLRIGDVLNLRTDQLQNAKNRRLTVRELKTGKRRQFTLPPELYQRALQVSGKLYVFPHRLDWRKHRTRQAVYKDLKRTAKLFRIPLALHISPHSARKSYAVEAFQKAGDLKKVQGLLNHSNEAVTMIYAMADQLTERRLGHKI